MIPWSTMIGVATAAGISASVTTASCTRPDAAVERPASVPDTVVAGARPMVRRSASYRDGVYTATVWYGGLPSSITVTVTLDDDIITAVEVTPHATDPTSLGLQRRFAAAVPAVVVGKPIDEVKVGRLAGSSGTPVGFNDAIRRIKSQAST